MQFSDNNKLPALSKSAPDGKVGNAFGQSVSIDVNVAVVGAPNDSVNNKENQGAAYVFVRINGVWVQQAKLTASDGSAGDSFGYAVSVSRDYIVIGAHKDTVGNNPIQGSAYIFRNNGINWTQQAKIVAADGATEDAFGISVSIDYITTTAIIGAYGDDIGAEGDKGSAYVFSYDGSSWTQQAKLVASNGGATCQFGEAVSISANTAVIGALRTNNGSKGAAYFFTRTGSIWTEQAIVYSLSPFTTNGFARSLSLSGDRAIVAEVDYSNQTGRAYIFERMGTVWTRTATLTATVMEQNDQFGYSVSISGDYAAVGCPGDKVLTLEGVLGSVYIYKLNGSSWDLLRKLEDTENFVLGRLGSSVGIDVTGFNIIGGAPDNAGPTVKGKVLFLNFE